MQVFLSFVLISLTGILFQGCGSGSKVEAPVTPDADVHTWLPLELGGHNIEVQVAITHGEQRRGLMFRDSLGAHQGMLFVYRQPQAMSFWMANTRIHLDIGFFDVDGVLQEVHQMVAGDTTPTQSMGNNLSFALEMNRGWFAANNVSVGAQLDIGKLAQALRRRGVDPREFGLHTR
ncbi:MAG: DUF192 domain-containing protein [Verrucomicrobia bacterium]|nr:DUF192 domain-containing protein [Verrucomicrobiota bacterium]